MIVQGVAMVAEFNHYHYSVAAIAFPTWLYYQQRML